MGILAIQKGTGLTSLRVHSRGLIWFVFLKIGLIGLIFATFPGPD
jgi:hypothetical protein